MPQLIQIFTDEETITRVPIAQYTQTRPSSLVIEFFHKDEFSNETEEILIDKELMAAIQEGERDIKEGRVYDWEDVKKELGRNTKKHVSRKTHRTSKKRA